MAAHRRQSSLLVQHEPVHSTAGHQQWPAPQPAAADPIAATQAAAGPGVARRGAFYAAGTLVEFTIGGQDGPCSIELTMGVARHVTWLLGEALDEIWSPASDDWMSVHYSEDAMRRRFDNEEDDD